MQHRGMTLQSIMLSERLTKENMGCNSIHMKFQKRKGYIGATENKAIDSGVGGEVLTTKSHEGNFWGDAYIPRVAFISIQLQASSTHDGSTYNFWRERDMLHRNYTPNLNLDLFLGL